MLLCQAEAARTVYEENARKLDSTYILKRDLAFEKSRVVGLTRKLEDAMAVTRHATLDAPKLDTKIAKGPMELAVVSQVAVLTKQIHDLYHIFDGAVMDDATNTFSVTDVMYLAYLHQNPSRDADELLKFVANRVSHAIGPVLQTHPSTRRVGGKLFASYDQMNSILMQEKSLVKLRTIINSLLGGLLVPSEALMLALVERVKSAVAKDFKIPVISAIMRISTEKAIATYSTGVENMGKQIMAKCTSIVQRTKKICGNKSKSGDGHCGIHYREAKRAKFV